jgi:hypothetical protein
MANHCKNMGVIIQDDAEAVYFAARLLGISEFRLFEMAYANWFGNEATEKVIDGFFGSYLKSGLVPFWLRDMVRKIIHKNEKQNLLPNKSGINQTRVRLFEKEIGWILVGLLGILFFAVV